MAEENTISKLRAETKSSKVGELELKGPLQELIKLAKLPVTSPVWRASNGEEYLFHASSDWVVINEKIGPRRERIICMVIGSVVVEE